MGSFAEVARSARRMGEPRRCWLRWHNYSDSVTSALESLRYDEDFLDVTVACEGRTIRAHKLVLSACSAYFRKVLKDHPCDHPIIILDGLGWREVVALLHFMYCGEVVVEEEELPNLLSAASNLSVTGLTHVTMALASTQATGEEDTDEDYEDDEEEEEEEEKATKLPESTHVSKKEEAESEKDSSYESDAPPASKRQRRDSSSTQETSCTNKEPLDESQTSRRNSVSSKKDNSSPPPVVTNGLTPTTQAGQAATPVPINPATDVREEKEEDKESTKVSKEKKTASKDKTKGKLVNGNNHIKEEMEEYLEDDFEGSRPENGDSDYVKNLSDPEKSSGGSVTDSIAESAAAPVTPPLSGGVNYTALLTRGILPSVTNMKTDTILISPFALSDKIVQKVLLPAQPSTGASPSCTSPSSSTTSVTTPTATLSTNSQTDTSPSQPYIQPPLVSVQEVQATLEQYQRKLAFHEPRPCPTCKRMYRDAATLRTHMAIMHAEGREPFSCTCGALFRTKYDMYQHKKNGHR
ncbi:protein abrupt isoform X1 [Penaeus vannamei]|uniref:protein abrupt isoform X1 n=2 Tax=Penaeus vannamei TaxID=6689 RepID=UPI00387F9917